MCNVDYQHPSNELFIELHLKWHDLIELRTAMIMYKANTVVCIPVNLQVMFRMSVERIHHTRNSRNVIGLQVFARNTVTLRITTYHNSYCYIKHTE